MVISLLLLIVSAGNIHAYPAAGTTVDRATRIYTHTDLTVQSGSNYIRIESEYLPAVVTYIPSAPFGTIPVALVMGDTIEAEVVFADCGMTWRWTIEEGESDKIIEIKAHESALIQVAPHVCETTYSDTTATACGGYEWRGQWYDATGDYPIKLVNAAGCDSIRTLKLTIHQPTSGEETLTACDSLLWNEVWYKESGDYTFSTTNTAGCDSTATLHLTVHHSYHTVLPDTAVCETEFYDGYVWHDAVRGDTVIHDSGTYSRGRKSVNGCDSILTQTVTMKQPTYSSGAVDVTAYDRYTTQDGTDYTKSVKGAMDYLVNAAGCDSIVTLNLTIRHLQVKDEFTRTLCETELPYEWYGKFYTESGVYSSDTIQGKEVDGVYMDTVHTVDLTVLPVSTGDTAATACGSFTWYGTTYTQSATPTHTFKNKYDCDSVVTLRLTINQPSESEETKSAYDSYEWNGELYTKSGDYTYQTKNKVGCDSTVTLHLTMRHLQKKDTYVRTFCETDLPYEWYGKQYYASGIYSSDTIQGKEVDGIYMDTVYTVDLTVIPTSFGDTTATACGSFTWYGTTYTQSATPTHTFKNKYDCDSIVTLRLTINQPSASEETKRVCESYEWNGELYTKSGDYTYQTKNKVGCDSTVTLHLTVNHASGGELTVEKCERYTSPAGHEYTESGTYTETITNKAGCDSTITIYLTILHDCLQPAEYDTVYFCRGFNREHEERVSDVLIRRYLPYTYESPAEWDYMEGVMLQTEQDRTLMDLARAEANLRNHYIGELTPVERIVWSVRYDKSNTYTPIEAGDQPQWINVGRLAVQIQFRCGEIYNTSYPMDTETVNGEETNGRKILRNGQIIIIRNGKEYNLLGEKIQ